MNSLFIVLIRWIPAIILLQTLFYKFSAHPTSVHIFSTLSLEPFGRIATGVLELMASILLVIPLFSIWGALLSIVLMTGAILSHIIFLGINVLGDGGQLFGLAIITCLFSALIIWENRRKFI
jgi:putative oxidoreductase